jgi:hypothetical protein
MVRYSGNAKSQTGLVSIIAFVLSGAALAREHNR